MSTMRYDTCSPLASPFGRRLAIGVAFITPLFKALMRDNIAMNSYELHLG
jgi:hypothetical protein